MDARGIPSLARGDMVTIEILHHGTVHTLSGRASRPRTAYFSKSELAAIAVGLHDLIWFSIVAVNDAVPLSAPEAEVLPETHSTE